MKALFSSAAVAFAIANLYLLYLTGPLVSPKHQLIFHLPGSASALFAPVILDLLLATLLLAAMLYWARRHPRAELILFAVLLLPLPWSLLETAASFSGQPGSPALLWAAGLFAAIGPLIVAIRVGALLPAYRRVRGALKTLLSFVALSGVVILIHLLWWGWKDRDLNPPFASRVPKRAALPAQEPPTGSPRVIWILLDELSYRQVYGHRFAGLTLPNFDRLASESTVFPQAVAAAQYTRIAMPSLLTGLALSDTNPTSDGQHLLLHTRGQRGWHTLQPENTVFGDAVKAGLPTGVAGWYEPYCRLLPTVLDRCFWTYSDNIPGGLSPSAPVLRNAVQPPRQAILAALHELGMELGAGSDVASAGARDVRQHREDYRALLAAGDDLLMKQTSGLVLLHMPIPHPWGFYDRRTGSFPGRRTSYLDNLALADAYVGRVRALLEAQGSWDSSDIVIMGDHGWRVNGVWRRSGFWTAEEDAASAGAAAVDGPAIIVKLHGQHTPAIAAGRFDAVRTRGLIDALLAGRLSTVQDLADWVARDEQARTPVP